MYARVAKPVGGSAILASTLRLTVGKPVPCRGVLPGYFAVQAERPPKQAHHFFHIAVCQRLPDYRAAGNFAVD